METGKVNTILQQLSTEKHQWWGTQKVRGFLQRCKTSRLSRRRETVRPREVVPRPPSKLLSCLRLNADLLTVTITMSSCQWPLIVVADSGCVVVVVCAAVLVSSLSQENDTATLHWTEAAIFASGCQYHLSTLSAVRTQRRSMVRRLARKGEWGERFVITVNTWPGLHTPHSDPWRDSAPMRFLLSYF